jgi:hypothetical protein
MAVRMVDVESSNIDKIGHDPEKNELHVHFRGGSQYIYHDVPAADHAAFMAADSKGKHHRTNIIGKYKYTKQ